MRAHGNSLTRKLGRLAGLSERRGFGYPLERPGSTWQGACISSMANRRHLKVDRWALRLYFAYILKLLFNRIDLWQRLPSSLGKTSLLSWMHPPLSIVWLASEFGSPGTAG